MDHSQRAYHQEIIDALDQTSFFPSPFALSTCYLAATGSVCLFGGQLNSFILLEGLVIVKGAKQI